MTSFNFVQKYENRIFHFIDTLRLYAFFYVRFTYGCLACVDYIAFFFVLRALITLHFFFVLRASITLHFFFCTLWVDYNARVNHVVVISVALSSERLPPTSEVKSSNPSVRTFDHTWKVMVNTLPRVVGFLRVLRFPPTGKLTGWVRINS